ncbi:MAG: PAS domain-containing protein, partial [Flavisolibacter sp.]|nr:PAS domain-containing protein [Flavisolibacter sp.]
MQKLDVLQAELLPVFNSLPGPIILLLPDTPRFTVVAVSDDYLSTTHTRRDDLVGKGLFEVFTDNPQNHKEDRKRKVIESLRYVVQHKGPHLVDELQYDLWNPVTRGFEDRTWRLYSKPVFDKNGEVEYIIHQVDDRTHKITIDASEQEDNIRRLRQSEQQVRAIIESAPFPIGVYIGKEMRIQFANQSIVDVWGKGPDLVGKTYSEVLPELANQEIYEQLDYVYTTGKPLHKRGQRVDLVVDGKLQPFYFNYSFTPLFNSDGSVYGVMNTAAEITDLVTAKQQVEQSERNFRNMILQSPVAMCILSGEEHVIDVANEKMIQLWGKPKESVMGNPVFEALPDARDQGLEALLSEVYQKGITHKFDQRPVELVRNGKTETVYQNFVYQPYKDVQGGVIGVLAISVEVTNQVLYQQQLKQNEETLQQRVAERTEELEEQRNLLNNILINSSNGISVTEMMRDENGTIIDAKTILANDAAVSFTGLTREMYLSKTAKEIDPDILESHYGKTCIKTLETGEPSFTQYYLEYTGRWLELTISKMDDAHLIHIFTDVTPIKEAQLQLERLVKDLKRSNVNLEEFAYAASHDMKEPIRKIHFFANRLKEELEPLLNQRQHLLFDKLETASQRVSDLIDDLLTYSQVTKGMEEEQQEVNLDEIIKAVLQDLELQVHEKDAEVKIAPLPAVKGNRRQLQQLFQNLINNALKYSKENEHPVISITASLVKGRDVKPELPLERGNLHYHLIEVSDNGIGFSQHDAERIFNVFTRLHGNSEYKGTGVGLSIARKVAENHKGFI